MALTTAQLQALKADIAADPALKDLPRNSDSAFAIADAYNLPANPDFWVWKTTLRKIDVVSETGPDGTVFSWSSYIARSAAEQNAWAQNWNSTLTVNPSLPQVRAAFADIFSGSNNNAPATRTHLLAMARRKATRAEKLFATGTGTAATPATLTFEGALRFSDVEQAWNS
jgi:hypothetical protein